MLGVKYLLKNFFTLFYLTNLLLIDSLVLVDPEEPELRGAGHAALILTDIGLALQGLPHLPGGTGPLQWDLGLRHPRENLLPGVTLRAGLHAER
jgi:hypothetical protein